MRMKVGVAGVCAVFMALAANAALRYLTDAERQLLRVPDGKLTAEQRLEKRALMDLYYASEEGGDAIIPGTPKGRILVVNRQTRVPSAALTSVFDVLTTIAEYDVRFTADDGNAELKIRLIDDPEKPSVAVYLDDCRAEVNVRRLGDDRTPPEALVARTRKSILRAFASLASGSTYGTPLFGVMKSPKDLDKAEGEVLPVDISMRIHKLLGDLGMKPVERTSYKELLSMGHDVAPTNGYQKAIYDSLRKGKK